MGKKKSKTSKQKQAKAAAKSLKSRVVREQHIKVDKAALPGLGKKKKGKRNNSMDSEKSDFQRQQESMKERHMAEENQRKRLKRGQKNKKNGKTNVTMFQFQAPTLVVDDAKKSTTQLMTEVTNQAKTWEGIQDNNSMQIQSTAPQVGGPISLKNVFKNSTLLKPEPVPISKNPFAALGMESDDEEEDEKPKEQPAAPLFQFTPATFSFAARTTPAVNNIDPDL